MEEINIKIKRDNLETEFKINDADDATKVLLIQNVFNLFDSKISITEVLELLSKTGLAYKAFYDKMDGEKDKIKIVKSNDVKEDIGEKLIKGYTAQIEEVKEESQSEPSKELQIDPEEIKSRILSNSIETNDDYGVTGVKIRNGVKNYKLHYECPMCRKKANHAVPEGAKSVYCHDCNKDMEVKDAHPDGFPNRDGFGNFYRAGTFKDFRIWKE